MVDAYTNPINSALHDIKSKLLPCFVSKWSNHQHGVAVDQCNMTLTMDGNWKLGRFKCIYGDMHVNSEEFGEIRIGCRLSPVRSSYYCKMHQGLEIKFKYGDKLLSFNPSLIKTTRLCKFLLNKT